jgi:hypothetical protein
MRASAARTNTDLPPSEGAVGAEPESSNHVSDIRSHFGRKRVVGLIPSSHRRQATTRVSGARGETGTAVSGVACLAGFEAHRTDRVARPESRVLRHGLERARERSPGPSASRGMGDPYLAGILGPAAR